MGGEYPIHDARPCCLRLVWHSDVDWRPSNLHTVERSHKGGTGGRGDTLAGHHRPRVRVLHGLLGSTSEHHPQGHRMHSIGGGVCCTCPHCHELCTGHLGLQYCGRLWPDASSPVPVCSGNAKGRTVPRNFLPCTHCQRWFLGHPRAQHPRLHPLFQEPGGPAGRPGCGPAILHGCLFKRWCGSHFCHCCHLWDCHHRPCSGVGADWRTSSNCVCHHWACTCNPLN
mmetsp:Transcript_2542/g.5292  ORF Transcript_2542/g.5292 Transcript_2542/m.5292 type:complete len:226 (+) Transcript_2542:630-1307(+)